MSPDAITQKLRGALKAFKIPFHKNHIQKMFAPGGTVFNHNSKITSILNIIGRETVNSIIYDNLLVEKIRDFK